MKKNLVRIVAALLVAMLALTLIPMGAFAIEAIYVEKHYFETDEPKMSDYFYPLYDSIEYAPGETIKVSHYDKNVIVGDSLYDFTGFIDCETMDDFKNIPDPITDPDKYAEWAKKTDIPFRDENLSIPKDLTSKEGQEWLKTWTSTIYAAYTPHQHKLSRWYSDGTTHWKECLVCKKYRDQGFWEQFMYQNWCQDGDEDGICNICGGDVPYHDIKVIETEGATITLNRDNASHRMKITADVEAKDGYTAGKVHFVKVRDDGSKQEITRYKKDGQFFTFMPTYEMEVSVDVTKK